MRSGFPICWDPRGASQPLVPRNRSTAIILVATPPILAYYSLRETSHSWDFCKSILLALLAEGGLRLGKLPEGLASVHEGLRLTQTTLDRFYEPELWRLKGELLLAQSKEKKKTPRSASRNAQAKEAEQCFQCALKIARERGARSLELRVAMSLARLEQMEGKRGTAHDLLASVYGWFTEGHDTLDLQEARTLLG